MKIDSGLPIIRKVDKRTREYKKAKQGLDKLKQAAKDGVFKEAETQLKKSIACQFRCSDGSGKKVEEHYLGCPYYSSGHSIDVNGNCNMGCC